MEKKRLELEEKLKLEKEKKAEEEEKIRQDLNSQPTENETASSTGNTHEATKPPEAFLLPSQKVNQANEGPKVRM